MYKRQDNFLSSTYQPLLQKYDDLLNLDVEYIGGDGQTESNITNRLGKMCIRDRPYGGIKMAVQAAETYGYNVSDKLKEIFTKYHKTHNTAVFDAYTPEMMKVRHAKILTGLPDTYGRGRIVGDYRRVALYGLDYLIEEKKKDKANCGCGQMTDDVIRLREEIAEQIKCLEDMKKLAEIYGYDISRPATNAKEAVQWLYFGYLAAIKTQNEMCIRDSLTVDARFLFLVIL